MTGIRSREEIEFEIMQVQIELQKISNAIAKELEKPFFERQNEVCLFLNFEMKLYTQLLLKLKWVLNE
jgi:hypothetical protein